MSYLGNQPGVSSQRTVTREIVSVATKTAFVPISGYSLGYVDVYVNGVQLDDTDFTAADGVNITLATAALNGDLVRIVAWLPRGLSDGYLKTEADARFLKLDGSNNLTGNLGVNTTPSSWGSYYPAIEGNGASAFSFVARGNAAQFGANFYQNNSFQNLYAVTGQKSAKYVVDAPSGTHSWFVTNTSGTAGNAISFTQAMTLDASGNLGVGTTSPSRKLSLDGGAGTQTWTGYQQAGSEKFVVGLDASGNPTLNATISAPLIFKTNDTERARIDSSGNLMVGTTTSGGRFSSVAAAGGTSLYLTDSTYSTLSIKHLTGFILSYETLGSAIQAWTTNGAERMRVDASGNFMVGATSANGKVQVTVASSSQTGIQVNTPNSFSAVGVQSSSFSSAGTGWYHYVGQSGNGSAITANNILIYGNGDVRNANGVFSTISDIKLKENVVDTGPKLSDLMQVRIVNYNLKASLGYETHKQIGVVAQELEQIFPGLIDDSPDFEMVTTTDEDGNETTARVATGTSTKSVKYSVFVPMLIKAMQEQQAIIEQLLADVKTLKEAA